MRSAYKNFSRKTSTEDTNWETYTEEQQYQACVSNCVWNCGAGRTSLRWCDRPDVGCSRHLWNVGQFSRDYTKQHPRRQSPAYLSLLKPEISWSFVSILFNVDNKQPENLIEIINKTWMLYVRMCTTSQTHVNCMKFVQKNPQNLQ
jgi:hypothetical protein